MTPDWASFTPYGSLAGGMLIGLAASLLVLGIGRVAGISGIVGGLLDTGRGDRSWRLLFVAGLVLAPFAWRAVGTLPEMRVETSLPLVLIAGLLVGYGTRLGSGCTSGHGVCGIARRSTRSIVATGIFMTAGFIATGALRPMLENLFG